MLSNELLQVLTHHWQERKSCYWNSVHVQGNIASPIFTQLKFDFTNIPQNNNLDIFGVVFLLCWHTWMPQVKNCAVYQVYQSVCISLVATTNIDEVDDVRQTTFVRFFHIDKVLQNQTVHFLFPSLSVVSSSCTCLKYILMCPHYDYWCSWSPCLKFIWKFDKNNDEIIWLQEFNSVKIGG